MKNPTTQKLSLFLATLGGIGYFPFAPGTVATAVSLGLLYVWSFFNYSWTTQVICICMLTCIALLTIPLAMTSLNKDHAVNDPSSIVIDEMIGTCVTFFCVPFSYSSLLLGFVLFRFFDIYKPFGISSLEQLPEAGGIIADDILAGLYSLLILQSYYYLFL